MILWPPVIDEPSRCGYLPDRDWRLEYQVALSISPEEYAARMLGGWRRFGRTLFRPSCIGCDQCRPIRVDVERFRPDRSQRRARKRNEAEVVLEIGTPEASAEALELYQAYHASQRVLKGWPSRRHEGPADYAETFVDNPLPTEEWRFRLGRDLVGVGYVDVLPVGLSAITFIHDPRHRDRSLGTWNVLTLIERARHRGLPHAYLGYYIADCPSMAYKARFVPNQLRGPDGAWVDFRA